jgi:hypothetical protein
MVWVMLRSVTYCGYDVNISFVVGLRYYGLVITLNLLNIVIPALDKNTQGQAAAGIQ